MNKKWIVLAIVAVLAAVSGSFIPGMIGGGDKAAAAEAEKKKADEAKEKKAGDDTEEQAANEPKYVPLGRYVVNINDVDLAVFLTVDVMMETLFEKTVKEYLEKRRPVVTTAITAHLADKTREDLRGKRGITMLVRELKAIINQELFDEGVAYVDNVYLMEYRLDL